MGAGNRVVMYIRVSALMGRGGDDFHSPSLQLEAMRATVKYSRMREVAVIEDIDQSGRSFARAGIDRIKAMAESGQLDAVAVYRVNRLGRNVLESLQFLTWLSERGVTILSASEHIDTSTPAGRMMLTNMLAVAEMQSDEIGENWAATIARRARMGYARLAVGYRKDPKSPVMVPDPVMAPAVRRVFRDYADGVPISRIAEQWAADRGRPVFLANLKQMLRRPVYLGVVVAHGDMFAGLHEPLVDETTWRKVQDRLARDAKAPPRFLELTWALAGLAFCPAGHVLQKTPHRHRTTREVVERLACSRGPSRGVTRSCVGIGFPVMARVEAEVLRQVTDYIRLLRTDPAAAAEVERAQRVGVEEAAGLRRRLDELRRAMGRLAKAWAEGAGDVGGLKDAQAELAAEADGLELRLLAIDVGEVPQSAEEKSLLAEKLVGMWPVMSPSERNQALRTVVKRVEVRRAARWREPVEDTVRVVDWV
jgi:DNA invertase Pin-like site-specific DNA recombinase